MFTEILQDSTFEKAAKREVTGEDVMNHRTLSGLGGTVGGVHAVTPLFSTGLPAQSAAPSQICTGGNSLVGNFTDP